MKEFPSKLYLDAMVEIGRPCTGRELMEKTHTGNTTTLKNLRKLCAEGSVLRVMSFHDGRRVLYCLRKSEAK